MKITPLQQYLILGALAFLGIVFLFYQFLLKPINAKIDTLQSTLNQKKQDLEAAKAMVAKYVEFKKEADSIQRELEWYQNRIPQTIDKTKFLEAISFAQSRSGIVLTSLTFQSPTTPKDYTEVPASIRLNSDFGGLVNFLYQTSTSNLFMTVRDLTVTPAFAADHPNFTIQAQMVVSGIEVKQ